MARVMKADGVLHLAWANFPSFLRQRERVERLDQWIKGDTPDNERVYSPRTVTTEYQQLSDISRAPWLGLVINTLVQTIKLEGMRAPGTNGNLESYTTWQRNGFDARQVPLYRAAFGHGASFVVVEPGIDPLTGERMSVMRGVSAKRMSAFYQVDDNSGWADNALEADPVYNPEGGYRDGWTVRWYDELAVHHISCKGDGYDLTDWTYITYDEHPMGVPPVVRYAPEIDLDGKITPSIEPLIPLTRRIEQDTFDRLIVQRFGAWKIRYIAGLAKPDSDQEAITTALKLKVEDLLISDNPDTRFGTLDATDIAGFISAGDVDLRHLSALSQLPPHHLLGLSSNLQAEALAAAEVGLQRRSADARISFGESNEQLFRLTAKADGNATEARMFNMQSRWVDMETQTLQSAAQAFGMLATQLKVPVEMLWERIPNWSDLDTQRAKELIQSGEADALIEAILAQSGGATPPAAAAGQQQAPAAAVGADANAG